MREGGWQQKQLLHCAGRLIRHQGDYGAVVLMDHRYNVLKFRQMTPAWLQPLLKSTAMTDAPALLHKFFHHQSRTELR